MKLYADVTEAKSLISKLEKKGFQVTQKKLDIGDLVSHNFYIGIERKTDDFLNFKHMFTQIDELRKAYKKHYLIVGISKQQLIESLYKRKEQDYKNKKINKSSAITYKEAINTINSTVASLCIMGTPPIFCDNESDLADIVFRIFQKTFDDKKRNPVIHALRPEPKRPKATRLDHYTHLVSSLPGMDTTMGERLIKHFKTPMNVFNADIKQLQEVKGIGKKKAEKIIWAIGRN